VSVGNNLPTLPLGNYQSIRIGQFAIAIGNPEALSHSVTFGIISAEDRAIQAGNESGSQIRQYYNMLQTDAAINPGNSGGPLLNLAGQVVGVNTAVSTSGENLGFAIPVSTLKRALPYLMKDEQAPEPWLGVEITDTTTGEAKKIHLNPVRGAYVVLVDKNSPAAKAGLKAGDVIIGFDGTPIYSSNGLLNAVQAKLPGDKVTIEVWNATGEHVLHAVLGQAPVHLVVTP
jgi:serine protease Do